jgi:hypothetical protein
MDAARSVASACAPAHRRWRLGASDSARAGGATAAARGLRTLGLRLDEPRERRDGMTCIGTEEGVGQRHRPHIDTTVASHYRRPQTDDRSFASE